MPRDLLKPDDLPSWASLAVAFLRRWASGPVPPVGGGAGEQAPPAAALERLQAAEIDSLYYLLDDSTAVGQRVYRAFWGVQRSAAEIVLATLEKAGIRPVLFKGAEYTARYLASDPISVMNDIDVIVERQQSNAAKGILFQLGYRQAVVDPATHSLIDVDIADIARAEVNHYELFPFLLVQELPLTREERAWALSRSHRRILVAGDTAHAVVIIDLHHNVATDVDVAPLLRRSVPSALGVGHALAPTDHLWLTTSRFYTEVALHGKSSLRSFVYLLDTLRLELLDWPALLETAVEYELRPALFYYLSFADSLGPGRIPADVLAQLNPMKGNRLRDWGWQLGRLFDFVEPCPLGHDHAATSPGHCLRPVRVV